MHILLYIFFGGLFSAHSNEAVLNKALAQENRSSFRGAAKDTAVEWSNTGHTGSHTIVRVGSNHSGGRRRAVGHGKDVAVHREDLLSHSPRSHRLPKKRSSSRLRVHSVKSTPPETPTTEPKKPSFFGSSVEVVVGSVICGVVLFLLLHRYHVVGKALKSYIEQVDRDVIGVAVTMDNLWINPFMCAVHISGLVVDNPPGYKSRRLLRANKIVVSLDLWQYLRSWGVQVRVRRMVVSDIHVIYEVNWTSSNVKDVINFVYYGNGEKEPIPSRRIYSIHKVFMKDIKVTASPMFFGAMGPRVPVPIGDVYYDDFAESGPSSHDILRHVYRGLLERVLASNGTAAASSEFDDEIAGRCAADIAAYSSYAYM